MSGSVIGPYSNTSAPHAQLVDQLRLGHADARIFKDVIVELVQPLHESKHVVQVLVLVKKRSARTDTMERLPHALLFLSVDTGTLSDEPTHEIYLAAAAGIVNGLPAAVILSIDLGSLGRRADRPADQGEARKVASALVAVLYYFKLCDLILYHMILQYIILY